MTENVYKWVWNTFILNSKRNNAYLVTYQCLYMTSSYLYPNCLKGTRYKAFHFSLRISAIDYYVHILLCVSCKTFWSHPCTYIHVAFKLIFFTRIMYWLKFVCTLILMRIDVYCEFYFLMCRSTIMKMAMFSWLLARMLLKNSSHLQ